MKALALLVRKIRGGKGPLIPYCTSTSEGSIFFAPPGYMCVGYLTPISGTATNVRVATGSGATSVQLDVRTAFSNPYLFLTAQVDAGAMEFWGYLVPIGSSVQA